MKGRDVWIFDLDNTLYPADCDLFPQIDVLMGRYIGNLLNVDAVEAKRVQKDYFVRYGTTLRGLMDEHAIDPEEFLEFVHDVDLGPIAPNPTLNRMVHALPGRKYIFTNGSTPHAERVLDRLGISAAFDGIFDIAGAGYVPKPQRQTYEAFVAHFDITPARAIMIDDMARNLVPAYQMGMRTVWINTKNQWGSIDHCHQHIDHEAEDLHHVLAHYVGEHGGENK